MLFVTILISIFCYIHQAKRAFRALKGLTRLQAQVKGRILKRQTAIALRCIQALVKVQARSRAKHVLGAVEGQAVQQKLLQQLEHEAPVKKPEVSYHIDVYHRVFDLV